MSHPPNKLKWLQEPFGPFSEQTLFESHAKIQGPLHDFVMYRGGQHVGFDDTEFLTSPPPGADDSPITCVGVLELDDKSGLHSEGIRVLDRAIQFRYKSTMTLGRILQGGHSIRIKVTFEKALALAAIYGMRSAGRGRTAGPALLTLQSERPGGHRSNLYSEWVVVSLFVETYRRSRNFLARYQFLDTLQYLNRSWYEIIERRHPDHFIYLYQRHLSFSQERSEELLESTGMGMQDDSISKRRPRHVPKAEIRSHFIAHSEWLLAHQMDEPEGQRIISLVTWVPWFREMRRQRKRAWSRGIRWGWEHNLSDKDIENRLETEGQQGSEIDVSRFGPDRSKEPFMKRFRKLEARARLNSTVETRDSSSPASSPNPTRRPRRLRPTSSDEEDVKPQYDSDVDDEAMQQDDSMGPDNQDREESPELEYGDTPPPMVTFNQNISDGESSSEESDYEFVYNNPHNDGEIQERAARRPRLELVRPTHPDVINRVPLSLFRRPCLPQDGVVWFCPVYPQPNKRCKFKIDFTQLDAEKMILLGVDRQMARDVERQCLRAGITNLHNPKLVKVFEVMVDCHGKQHLHDTGIQ